MRREPARRGSLVKINDVISRTEHFSLREASDEDVSDLLRLMQSAFHEYEGVLDPPSAAHTETVDTVRKRLAAGSAVMATVTGERAGCAFYQSQDTHLYFSRLSVLPHFRRRGIGRALLEYVEGRARDTGSAGVRLGVRVQLPHLIAMYERFGYRITKWMSHAGYENPTYVYMDKDLRRD